MMVGPGASSLIQPFCHNKSMPKILQRQLLLYVLLPLLFYFLFFCFYTYPWITHFSTHFFGDSGDGLQNAWNLWWINKAVASHHTLWFTTELHTPHGTTLLGHTLNPINGLLTALLFPPLSLVQAYNLTVIAAFVVTGLTTFWLCYNISRSYVGSLIGGFAFTFSSYHFAHGAGHMNLITLQWLPLFILAWLNFIRRPNYWLAFLSALALLAVTLTDFYYLLFSIIMAAIMVVYGLVGRQIPVTNRKTWQSLGLFVILAALTVGPLAISVIRANSLDPFLGAHDPKDYGMNLLSPFIPNEIWHFAPLTQWFWAKDNLDIVEGSVNVSITVLLSFVIALFTIKKQPKSTSLWLWLAVIFAVLSIGPRLHVMGELIENIKMPYSAIVRLFPSLKLAGVPVRMMSITLLSGSIILSIILSHFKATGRLQAVLYAAVFCLLFLELWPIKMPMTEATVPNYITFLRSQPTGNLIDTVDSRTYALYYQTVHVKPMVGGYISRVPASVELKDQAIMNDLGNQDYATLWRNYQVRYLLLSPEGAHPTLQPIYRDTTTAIYDLSNL